MDFSYVNVIFVNGTVQTCLPFLRSLLDVTDLPLRLVSNACSRDEEQLLAEICDGVERLQFHSLRCKKIIEHGDALDKLLAVDETEFFAFMDSDIFATDSVSMADISPLPHQIACSSCLPVWHMDHDASMPESFQIMGGRYIRSDTGHFLGCSYLACYRTDPLRKVMARLNLSFRRYTRGDLPNNVLKALEKMGLGKQLYDTAKVVNIMLQHEGYDMSYRDIPELLHVGGVSANKNDHSVKFLRLKRAVNPILPRGLRNWINGRRYGCDPIEANGIADLYQRRQQAAELVADLCNGPPFSTNTATRLRHDSVAQELAMLFSKYSEFDARGVLGRHTARPTTRRVNEQPRFPR